MPLKHRRPLYSLEKLIEWKSIFLLVSLWLSLSLYSLEKLIEWKYAFLIPFGVNISGVSLLARETN